MQQPRERAIALPLLKAAMAGLVGRIAVGQVVPGSAGAQNPKNAVQHRPRVPPRPPALAPGRSAQKRLENNPLGVGEVHKDVLDLPGPIDNTKFDLL